MSKLQLLLLGHFECLLPSGERVSLTMRKAEVLLAFLALTPGIRHPRERLINLLWSDRSDEQARNSLRQCLSTIRKALGDSADFALQIDRTTVCLKAETLDVDALEFERLAGDADELVTAAELYRGEFLEGIAIRDAACQEWLDNERARFRRQYLEVLAQLAQAQLADGDFARSIRNSERLVEQDPLSESGWRLLMQACHANGDRSHALQAFKRCEKVLRDELGVDPEAETVALRDAIAGGETVTPTPAASIPSPTPPRPAATTLESHRIAVLPFDNLSRDAEQEYFSDGISESIIMNLSRFPDLQVKSRNASFAFKEQIKSLGEISRELDVDYIVEGSVRRAPDRVRVNVQLVEAASGNQVWNKRYDSELGDLFALEEDLSRSIATTLTGQIDSELQRIANAKNTENLESYDLMLQGIYFANRNDASLLETAIEKLNESLALDPANARAHANLSFCYQMGWIDHWLENPDAARSLCGKHGLRAIELDPTLGMAHVAYGEFLLFDHQLEPAGKHFHKALDLNPNDSEAIGSLAIYLSCNSRFAEALAHAELALRLDPYHRWTRWIMSEALFFSDRYDETLATIDEIGNPPGFIQMYRIAALLELGREAEARESLQEFVRFSLESMADAPRTRDDWLDYSRVNAPFADPVLNERLVDYLVRAGLDTGVPTAGQPSEGNIHNIAVLPFDNLSGDPDQEYFSDGITESIIMNLALFPGLQVKSRNSSFAFKQQLKGLSEISRELEVDYIVEGSIRKSGDRVRITVQLIEAVGGNQVWGKRYDAGLDALFDIEEELSRTLAATLTGQIESDLQRIAIGKGATDQQAYDLVLAGMYYFYRFNPADNALAIEKFERCLAMEPGNVRAHVGLYNCHIMEYCGRWSDDVIESRNKARQHVHRALELDPHNPAARLYFAEYSAFTNKPDRARPILEQLLSENPSDPEVLAVMTLVHEVDGRPQAGLETAKQVLALDPYHPWAEWELVVSNYLCGHYEDAIEIVSTMRRPPGFVKAFAIVSAVKLGRLEQARTDLTDFLEYCRSDMKTIPQNLDEWMAYTRANYAFIDTSINQELIDCLVEAGLETNLSKVPTAAPGDALSSIAVLPFDNLSGDPDQEYFSDGITESVILHLNQFPGLTVKSRHSSFAFKQQLKALGEISRELEVDYLVEGSLRKSASQVRITVQLVEAGSGNQLWSKRYDAPLDDLFTLEEELSRSIAATVTGQIESSLQRIAIAKGASDQQAYDLLLAGIYHLNKFDPDNMTVAVEKLDQCLALDPENVRAHATLGFCHMMIFIERWSEDYRRNFELAERHALRARELDPESDYVQIAYAEYLSFSGNTRKADIEIDRVLQSNPDNAHALAMKAMLFEFHGDFEAALETAELAQRLDPYHPWNLWNVAESQYLCGRYEAALDTIAKTDNAPGFIRIYTVAANVKLGRLDEARAALQVFVAECRKTMRAMPRTVDEWLQYSLDNAPFADSGINHDHIDCLRQAGLENELASTDVDPKNAAELPSILVLPFDNMSGDPEQDYFSDGITESIILSLGAFPEFDVKSRHASFAFRDSVRSATDIASELDAQFIVEGSIRQRGDRLRTTIQLSEAGSGNQLWGNRFDTARDDLLELEEELVRTIVATISSRIDRRIKYVAAHKPAANRQSYDHLMRGWYHAERFNPQDYAIAIEAMRKCLALEPDNTHAHSVLGASLNILVFENWTDEPDQVHTDARRHLEEALSLDGHNALAHAFMAEHHIMDKHFDKALYHAEKAIEHNPSLPDGYNIKALALSARREHDEAVPLAEYSLQSDPYHFYMAWNAGIVYREAGEYAMSVEAFRQLPHPPASVQAELAASLVGAGALEEGRAVMAQYLERAGNEMKSVPDSVDAWRRYWAAVSIYQFDEDFDAFFDLLLDAGLCEPATTSPTRFTSILVLPFANQSGDPEQEYFSDGITTSLILSLARFHGIEIKSQKTSFAFKESNRPSTKIATGVGADFLVEGSIRKSSNRIRLSVQLIEAANGSQVWGEQYDRELDDLLELEQELSQAIAATISGRLGHRLQRAAARKPASDMRSYDHLMRGLYHFGRFTAEDMRIAREEMTLCLSGDPDNVQAHTNLGAAHVMELLENWAEDRAVGHRQGRYHLECALDLDPENALAHAYFGDYLIFAGDWDKGEFHARRAIEINPNSSEGHATLADLLGNSRRAQEALQHAELCLQLDPYSVNSGWVAGDVYRNAGEHAKAIKTYRSIAHPPPTVHAMIAACFVDMGLLEEAGAEMSRYRQLAESQMSQPPDDETSWRRFWRENSYYRFDEDFEQFFDQLLQAGLCNDRTDDPQDLPSLAILPFENLSGDPEQEYFVDGITADLVETLSKFRHLRTVSRYSTLAYKYDKPSIEDIAEQQQVRYLLEGSVRRSGERIRVSAELIDTLDSRIVWSQRFDRDLGDLFTVQDELTQSIALAMKVQLDDGDMAIHRSVGTSDVKAWELVMSAVDLQDTYIRRNILEARSLAREAIERDPQYPYAWVSLAWTYWQEAYSGWSDSIDTLIDEAEKACGKGLELAPNYGEAWSQSAMNHLMRHEAGKAIDAANRAIDEEPGNAEVQALAGFTRVFNGEYQQAMQHVQNLRRLCPIRPNWYWLVEAQSEQLTGNLAQAAELYQQAIDVEPESPLCRFYLVNLHCEQGDVEAAQRLAEEIRQLDKSVTGRGLAHAFSIDPTLRDRFAANLAKFDLV